MKTAAKTALTIIAAAVLSACGSAGSAGSEVTSLLIKAGKPTDGIVNVETFNAAGSTGGAHCAPEQHVVTYADGTATVVSAGYNNVAKCVITGSLNQVADPFDGQHITWADLCTGVLKCAKPGSDLPAVTGPFEVLKQHGTMRAYGQQYGRVADLMQDSGRVDMAFASMNRARRESYTLCTTTLEKVIEVRDAGRYSAESVAKIARLEAECGHWLAEADQSDMLELCVASAKNNLQRNICTRQYGN